LIELKNTADSLIHSTQKSLTEHKEKIGAEVTKQVQDQIKVVQDALESEKDPEALKAKVDQLQQTAMKIGEAVYKSGGSSSSGSAGPSGSSGSSSSGDKTQEAEYEEKPKK
jgi:molecular chaperone DnaK